MKRLVFLVALSLVLAGPVTALQWGVKAGGGVNFEPSPSRWGGHGSIEIPLSEDYPTSLSVFFEMYRKTLTILNVPEMTTQIPAGLAIHYKAPLSRHGGTIYFTGGGGIVRDYFPVPPDPADPLAASGRASATEPIITVAGGAIIPVTESISAFGQFRWFKAFASRAVNQYGIQFGVHFPLGRE
jgi:hypothetical protein